MKRTRGRIGGALLLVLLALGGGYALRAALWQPLELVGEAPDDGYARASGVVHVHTTLSDGGGTPEEVIAAARAAGLAYIGITDHGNLDAKPLEGYRDGVLVLVGAELSTTAGHLLGLGLEEDPVYRFSGDALDGLLDVRDLGGFSFAAHPFSSRPEFRWTGWDLPGAWGLELINGDSEWRRAGPRLLLAAGLYRLNPRYALLRLLSPPDEALERWDAMLRERDVVGLYGADAHSRLPITRSWHLRFPSYEALFSLLRTHLVLDRPLSGETAADRRVVLDALRRGRFFIGLDALAPADGFFFVVEAGAGARWTTGDRVPITGGLRARAGGRVPEGVRLVLLRDGEVLVEGVERLETPLPGPGVYRVEARVPGWDVPWVISNPVVVFNPFVLDRRRSAGAWPKPPPPPRHVSPLESLPGSDAFNPEFDPSSRMNEEAVDPTAGPDGGPARQLAFRLGEPGPDRPFTWCALVNRQERDLRGYAGLRFRIRADGVYRVWVQVRDENPQSADEGQEWWFASVRTSTEWQELLLPFSRLRTINEKTDGQLDLDAVRGLVFVLDHAAVKPGTEGTIWISDLGVYN